MCTAGIKMGLRPFRGRLRARELIRTNLPLCTGYMIDTWLFAAICLVFISLVAVLRIIPGPTRNDRLSAMNAAITLMTGAALALTVAWGDVFILEVSIFLSAACYAATIAIARSPGSERI